jgi:hydroxymethylpyrimidine pyrophosphatase-like HAD family hydrolase
MHLVLATAMAAAVCDAACAFAPGPSLRWAPSYLRSSVSLPLCAPVRRRGCALKCELAGEAGARVKALGTKVKCIFSDVDGTLLDKQHRLQPETRQAIVDAMAAGIPFVMATGKSRGPWVQEVRQQLGCTDPTGYSLNGPGVFIQGLLVCDVHGKPVQQLTLSANVIAVMNSFAARRQIALVAYTSDDRIVCAKTDEHTDQIIPFNEPVPQAIGNGGMASLAAPGQPCVYKMMLMGPENVLAATRADLEQELAGIATVTKAMDDMLEILPLGASKWSGVSKGLGTRESMSSVNVHPCVCMCVRACIRRIHKTCE